MKYECIRIVFLNKKAAVCERISSSVILTLCDFLEFWTSVISLVQFVFSIKYNLNTNDGSGEYHRDKQTRLIRQSPHRRVLQDTLWLLLPAHTSQSRECVHVCVADLCNPTATCMEWWEGTKTLKGDISWKTGLHTHKTPIPVCLRFKIIHSQSY